jgi:hypothetical protein
MFAKRTPHGAFMVVLVLCGCFGCSDQTAVVGEKAPTKKAHVARTENTISTDTWGCLTFDGIVRAASSTAAEEPAALQSGGCSDLDHGEKVIGPLEVRVGPTGHKFARIEVPGKGERWTFLAHLEK